MTEAPCSVLGRESLHSSETPAIRRHRTFSEESSRKGQSMGDKGQKDKDKNKKKMDKKREDKAAKNQQKSQKSDSQAAIGAPKGSRR